MHLKKSLRDSFHGERLTPFIIQDMSYNKKNDKHRQRKKLHKKCTKTMSQPIKQLIAFSFSNDQRTAHYCDTVNRKQKPTKTDEYAKITKIFEEHEKWVYQDQRPYEENKAAMERKF